MLTLAEVLDDAAALPEFAGLAPIGVNTRGASGWTPLHWMAYLGDLVAIDLLVAAGARLDAADDNGNTPLHEAVEAQHHLAVGLLLRHGADANLRNLSGHTARELASIDDYEPVLEVFRAAG